MAETKSETIKFRVNTNQSSTLSEQTPLEVLVLFKTNKHLHLDFIQDR